MTLVALLLQLGTQRAMPDSAMSYKVMDERVEREHGEKGFVSLRGTKKSGTTLSEVIGNGLLKAACDACGGNVIGSARENSGVTCPCAGKAFSVAKKHLLPGASRAESLNLKERKGQKDSPLEKCLGSESYEACFPTSEWGPGRDDATEYLVIERDPRAVMLSYFHYHEDTNTRGSASTGEALHDYASTSSSTSSSNIQNSVLNIGARHFLFTTPTLYGNRSTLVDYADLIDNPVQTYGRFATLLGVRHMVTDEKLMRLINDTSCAAMREMEQEGELPGHNDAGSPEEKVRSCKVDGWKEELSSDDQEVARQVMKQFLQSDLQKRYMVENEQAAGRVLLAGRAPGITAEGSDASSAVYSRPLDSEQAAVS